MRRLAILVALLPACTAPTGDLLPGEVWRSASVAGEPPVSFVVLQRAELDGVGPVVGVRLGGLERVPADVDPEVERRRFAVYPAAILERHASELATRLPRDLFPSFDVHGWVDAADPLEEPVTTLAPSLVVASICRSVAGLHSLLDEIPVVHIPRDTPTEPSAGPRLTVAIVTTKAGERRGQQLIGHEVAYVVGATRCASLDTMVGALRLATRGKTPQPVIVVAPGSGVNYGDVAEVVDRISNAGYEKIIFGALDGPEPRLPPPERPAPLAAGQVWSFRTPEGEPARTLTIQAIVEVPGHGEVAFVRVDPVAGDPADGGWAPHLVATLRPRLLERSGTADVTPAPEVLAQWRAGFARGTAGYATASPFRSVLIRRARK